MHHIPKASQYKMDSPINYKNGNSVISNFNRLLRNIIFVENRVGTSDIVAAQNYMNEQNKIR